MGILSKAKNRLRGRGKSTAARPGQDTVSEPSTRPDGLSGPLTAALVVGRSSTASNAAAGERPTHDAGENADENADENAGEKADESLWDRAYQALDPGMVADYEAMLADVVKEQVKAMDGAGKRAVQEMADEVSQRGKTAYEAKKLQYSIFNKTLVASKLISGTAALVNRFKPIIDEAVKASAAASFAWVGISLALGILANPQGVHEENLNGLAKVTWAMHYYTKIEPLLLRQKQDRGASAGVYREIEELVVDLYASILDFECRSALRFYCPRLRRIWKDMLRVDDWKAMLSKIETSEAVLKDRSTHVLTLIATDDQRAAAEHATDILSDIRKQLQAHKETLNAMLDLEKTKKLFEEVPFVPEARYDSAKDQSKPRCQEDTRVATLKEIDDWVQMPGARGVFWLSGPAGSGKSTISRTVAASLHGRGRLAASYFFLQPDRCKTDKVFTTIAHQLVDSVPGFGVELYKSLEKTHLPVSQLRDDLQCKRLIIDPLSRLSSVPNVPNAPVAIVIDGLDECDGDIEAFGNVLCSLPDAMPGRLLIFLASRDVRSIANLFATRDHGTYGRLDLLKRTEESVSDITAFVTREFENMAKKRRNNAVHTDETLSRVIALCTKPSPLFVFASTLCRSVSSNTSPSYQLTKWLENCESRPESRLEWLYASVIRQALINEDGSMRYDDTQRKDILTIIGSLMFLSRPLSCASLAALLGMDLGYASDMLNDFRPVLNIPDNGNEQIQILHTSFVEFMRGHSVEDMKDFIANEDAMHSTLFQRCIAYMGENLKQDLCELGDPTTHINNVDRSVLDTHIPDALKYACYFWSKHAEYADENAFSTAFGFLKDHLLHWLEAMTLFRNIFTAFSSIRRLHLLGMRDDFVVDIIELMSLLLGTDLGKFPLQVYGSPLIFYPIIQSTQWTHRLPVIESAAWSTKNIELMPSPMQGHEGNTEAVAFSRTYKVLASCSDDGTVRLWSTMTRQCIEVVRIGKVPVTSVAYSPDGRALATASDCIRLWNSFDYELERSFGLDMVKPLAIVFVPRTDDLVAYMADNTLRAWNYKTGEAREHHGTMETSMGLSPRCLAVSDNGQLLAGAVNQIVVLFDTQTLEVLHKWQTFPGCQVTSLGFSEDDQAVIVASASWGVRAWSTTSYGSRLQLERPQMALWSGCALSSDCQLLAIQGSATVSVYAMDDILAQDVHGPEALEKAKPLLVYNAKTTSASSSLLCFSPVSRELVVPVEDCFTLLDVPDCQQTNPSRYHSEDWWRVHSNDCVDVYHFSNSRNRQKFVTVCQCMVAVWNFAGCQCQFVVPGRFSTADLSADGQYLAVSACTERNGVSLYPQTHTKAAGLTGSGATAGAAGTDGRRARLDVDGKVDGAVGLVDHNTFAVSMAFSADSQLLAAGYGGCVIRLWNVVTQKHISTGRGMLDAESSVTSLAFSEDSLQLAAGLDSEIHIYKVGEMGLSPVLAVKKPGVTFGRVHEFWPGSRYLETGLALVDLEKCSVDASKSRLRLPGKVYLVDGWVVRDGVRLLWAGEVPRFRMKFFSAVDQFVLSFRGGRIVVVTLAPSS